MPTSAEKFSQALYESAPDFGIELRPEQVKGLTDYYQLLLKWNSKLHLVAPCAPAEFATRHILESLLLLPFLSRNARVVDIGSGGGLPIVPCLIVRDDLRAVLIESSRRKGVFLREALRLAKSRTAEVVVERFEGSEVPAADFVTCRALDKFQKMLPALVDWAPKGCELLLFAGPGLRVQIEEMLSSARAYPIPKSDRRFLIQAKKEDRTIHETTRTDTN
ncbi:MAG: 16S rRNA (guanine(527)-N(7))-methyltransferase RsmG [Acidobacteriota bacterium]